MKEVDTSHIEEFLACPTPQAWLDEAVKLSNLDLLLIDHANCEKKAASMAMTLIYRCSDKFDLLNKMSKLAREELRHFEQVLAIMKKRDIVYKSVSASSYASKLHQYVRTWEPARLSDSLIIGAIIEARSCERFAALAPLLDEELKAFYLSLLKSEARHYQDYLNLAKKYADEKDKIHFDERVTFFLEKERALIEAPDEAFRFHSGVPV